VVQGLGHELPKLVARVRFPAAAPFLLYEPKNHYLYEPKEPLFTWSVLWSVQLLPHVVLQNAMSVDGRTNRINPNVSQFREIASRQKGDQIEAGSRRKSGALRGVDPIRGGSVTYRPQKRDVFPARPIRGVELSTYFESLAHTVSNWIGPFRPHLTISA
jgi:hypothetical protein